MFSVIFSSNHFLTPTLNRFRPAFFTLLYLWRTIGFDGEMGLRLLPLMFGILSMPMAWVVGLRLGGRGLALGLSLLLATSPIHIEFSQELRMYSLVVFLSLAQLALYLRYREKGNFAPLFWGTLVAAVGIYTHLFYIFYLMGFALLALLDRRAVRFIPFIASLFIAGLLYLPNLGSLLVYRAAHYGSFPAHLPSALPKLAAAISVGFNLFRLPELAIGRGLGWQVFYQNWYYILPCVLVFGMLLVGAVRWLTVSSRKFALTLILALLVFPVVATSLLSLVTRQNFSNAKFLLFILPPVLLLFAWGFQGLKRRSLQISVGFLYSLLIGVSLFHFYTDLAHYGRRINWREAAHYLQGRVSSEAPVVLFSDYGYSLLFYYNSEIYPYRISIKTPGEPADIADYEHYKHERLKRAQEAISPHENTSKTSQDSIEIAEYAHYLRGRLKRAREVYYVREDEPQNDCDPKDIVLKAMRTISTDEMCIPYNRRLQLYGWTLKNDI